MTKRYPEEFKSTIMWWVKKYSEERQTTMPQTTANSDYINTELAKTTFEKALTNIALIAKDYKIRLIFNDIP